MTSNARILPASTEAWAEARKIIAGGGLVVFPTDTVYGVACNPRDPDAIDAIYAAKGRERTRAIPLLLSGEDQLGEVAQLVPASAMLLGKAFWPGALTLVVPSTAGLPRELGGGDTIAVRVPAHEDLRAFILACGGLLATTSANLSGETDASTAQQAAEYLGDQVSLVIDGGATPGSVPSTVVDCTQEPPKILRIGALDLELIQSVLDGNS